MNRLPRTNAPAACESEWAPFPGGELEGRRPRVVCTECRSAGTRPAQEPGTPRAPLCFQCYRLELERTRALQRAATLDTASDARFQALLPFEPVNRPRLTRLKVERQAAKFEARSGVGTYIEKRRRAQIEARHALAHIVRGIRERRAMAGQSSEPLFEQSRSTAGTALLEYPASWLPFIAAR